MMKGLLMAGFAGIMLFAGCDQMMHDVPKDAPTDNNVSTRPPTNGIDGKALFQANCATCHNPVKDATGPALQGSLTRWDGDTARLNAFMRNPSAMIKKDKYAKALSEKWKPTVMTAFPAFSADEFAAMLRYTDEYKLPARAASAASN